MLFFPRQISPLIILVLQLPEQLSIFVILKDLLAPISLDLEQSLFSRNKEQK